MGEKAEEKGSPACRRILASFAVSGAAGLLGHALPLFSISQLAMRQFGFLGNRSEKGKYVIPHSIEVHTASSSHLRTMLPEGSNRPLPAKQPNHATYEVRI